MTGIRPIPCRQEEVEKEELGVETDRSIRAAVRYLRQLGKYRRVEIFSPIKPAVNVPSQRGSINPNAGIVQLKLNLAQEENDSSSLCSPNNEWVSPFCGSIENHPGLSPDRSFAQFPNISLMEIW